MSSDKVIRTARRDDLPAIVAIFNAAVRNEKTVTGRSAVTIEQQTAWFEAHREAHLPVWVAFDGHTIAAWLSLDPSEKTGDFGATGEVSVYVLPAVQGRGFGTALLAQAVAQARGYSLRSLVAVILASNTRSLRLFRRARFVQWGNAPAATPLDAIDRNVLILRRNLFH